jgi:hypothetical protein
MGTGDDLTIAAEISVNGSARRFREEGVAVIELVGDENNLKKHFSQEHEKTSRMGTHIQMLSATPPSRPNKHFRRVSSWPNFISWSLDIFGVS